MEYNGNASLQRATHEESWAIISSFFHERGNTVTIKYAHLFDYP
jgi:hypothetical protein